MLNPLQTQKMPEDNFIKDTQNTVNRLKWRKANQMIADLTKQIKKAQEKGDMDLLLKLMKVQMKVKGIQQELSALLGTEGAIRS